MFGISFTEIAVIAMVALVVVGPQKLPGMLRTVGGWVGKLKRLTTEVRQQTGIDEILRMEGIDGGMNELRSILRGNVGTSVRGSARTAGGDEDPYAESVEYDLSREYPTEGPDSYDALPDDLVADEDETDGDGPVTPDSVPPEPPPGPTEPA